MYTEQRIYLGLADGQRVTMGLNMATYSGFSAFKYLGAITASIALCLPMVILTVQIFRFYNKFESLVYWGSRIRELKKFDK